MRSLNKVMLIGNIGNDPVLRFAASGNPVLNFRMAMNGRDSEGKELPEWLDVTLFGKLAEKINQYLCKGMTVFVEGRIHTRSWSTEQGVTQYRTGVNCDNIIMLSHSKNLAQDEGNEDDYVVTTFEASQSVTKSPPAAKPAAQAVKPAAQPAKPVVQPATRRGR